MSRPLLSVVIPSYNRPAQLAELLESVITQEFDSWECVVTEDRAPRRDEVIAVLESFGARSAGRIRHHLNEVNLGYDGSVRRLIELARGEFVFIMGDDDLVAPGALQVVAEAIRRHPRVGVLRGTFATFRGTPDTIDQVSRYYRDEIVIPAGEAAVVAAYRRLVVMSGVVIHRDSAAAFATTRWDGTLFYQHWVAANVLVERDALFHPAILAHFRLGGVPLFGGAAAEQGLYTPGAQPPSMDVRMVASLLRIAEGVEQERGLAVAAAVRRDLGTYMYPTLRRHAHEPWRVFFRFYRDLWRLGFGSNPFFHLWFWSLATVGAARLDAALRVVRRVLGHTPDLSRLTRR